MLAPLLFAVLMAKSVLTTDFECYDAKHPHMYTGTTAVTETGTPCQMWASQSPHQHSLGDAAEDFTDGELPAAYCRSTLDGDEADKPWCYTTDDQVRWEYCDVPHCSCSGGFVVYGASCFVYVNKTANWSDAQTHCLSLGGFLAEVKAFDQSEFLQKLVVGVGGQDPSWGAWLGGRYEEGQWAWWSTGKELTYTNWSEGEPTNPGSQPTCLETNRHNKWRAHSCAEEIDSICQKTQNVLPNDERINILASVVDQLQTTVEKLTNTVQNLTQQEPPTRPTPCAPTSTSLRRQPVTIGNVTVLCDTETDGGNWIIIQRRTVGDLDFFKDWADYENGFGTVTGDHWLGLTHIHDFCNAAQRCVVRFDVGYDGEMYYEEYSSFYLGDAEGNFKLYLDGPSGTAGNDILHSNNNRMQFTTPDRDNDKRPGESCAVRLEGPWWWRDCGKVNINGRWARGRSDRTRMKWKSLTGTGALTSSEMKVRLQ